VIFEAPRNITVRTSSPFTPTFCHFSTTSRHYRERFNPLSTKNPKYSLKDSNLEVVFCKKARRRTRQIRCLQGLVWLKMKCWPGSIRFERMRACRVGLRKAAKSRKNKESADKPGSVVDNHSSGTSVTADLKQPTRKHPRARHTLPYLVLLRMGFTMPRSVATRAVRSYRTFSPLPRLILRQGGRYIFCGTFRRLTPPRCYLASCPPEPGLSSRLSERLSGRLRGG
jgi:hypothetical protein